MNTAAGSVALLGGLQNAVKFNSWPKHQQLHASAQFIAAVLPGRAVVRIMSRTSNLSVAVWRLGWFRL